MMERGDLRWRRRDRCGLGVFAVGGGGAGDAEIVGGVVEEGGAEVGAIGGGEHFFNVMF